MNQKAGLFIVLITVCHSFSFGQSSPNYLILVDTDSSYIRKHFRLNDLRTSYGGQGNNMVLGSNRDSSPGLNNEFYTNTNDYIGVGLTYKWIDGDISFALPGTSYLKEERSNLTQFRLSLGYSTRKVSMRVYISNSKGVIMSTPDNEYQSSPTLHEFKIGAQLTFIRSPSKYSYRASLYQSEIQMKTAGSWLLRVEPFYRNLGANEGSMIPTVYDVESRFGDQVGLEYVRAPGVLVMPGYGINIVLSNPKFFISPVLLAGAGVALNTYEGNNGQKNYTNLEYAGSFTLNAGYSGSQCYSKIQLSYNAGYTVLNPSYLTYTNLAISFTFGYRFNDVEKIIPRDIF